MREYKITQQPRTQEELDFLAKRVRAITQGFPSTDFVGGKTGEIPLRHRNLAYNYFDNPEEIGAAFQGTGEKLVNGLIKGGVTMAGSMAENTAGWIAGAGQMVANAAAGGTVSEVASGLYDNPVGQLVDYINNDLRDRYPHYYSQEEQKLGGIQQAFNSESAGNFWTDKFLNGAGYWGGALATGFLLPKIPGYRGLLKAKGDDAVKATLGIGESGVSEAANLGVINKDLVQYTLANKFADASKQVAIGGVMSFGESSVEARQIKTDAKEKLLNLGYNEDEANQLSSSLGNVGFGINLVVTSATNMMQFGKAVSGGYGAKRIDMGRIVSSETGEYSVAKTNKWLNGVGRFAAGNAEEGGQEFIQHHTQKGLSDYYLNRFDKQAGFGIGEAFGAIYESIEKDAFSKESVEATFLGMLLGGPGQVVMGGKERAKDEKNLQTSVDLINKDPRLKEFIKLTKNDPKFQEFVDYTENTIRTTAFDKAAQEAVLKGDKFEYYNQAYNQYKSFVQTVEEAGGTELLLDRLDALKNIPAEEFKKSFGIEDKVVFTETDKIQRIEERKQSALKIAEIHRDITAKFPALSKPVFDTIFDAATNFENIDKREEELAKRVNELAKGYIAPDYDTFRKETKNYREEFNKWMEQSISQIDNPMKQDEIRESLKDLNKLAERREFYINQFNEALKNPSKIEDATQASQTEDGSSIDANIFTPEKVDSPAYKDIATNLAEAGEDDLTLGDNERLKSLQSKLEKVLDVEKRVQALFDAEPEGDVKEAFGKIIRERKASIIKEGLILKIQELENKINKNKKSGLKVLFDNYDIIGKLFWKDRHGNLAPGITEENLILAAQIPLNELPERVRFRKVPYEAKTETVDVFNHEAGQYDGRVKIKTGIQSLPNHGIIVEVKLDNGTYVSLGYLRDPNRFLFEGKEFDSTNIEHLSLLNPSFVEPKNGELKASALGQEYIDDFNNLSEALKDLTFKLQGDITEVTAKDSKFFTSAILELIPAKNTNLIEYLNTQKANTQISIEGHILGPIIIRRVKGQAQGYKHFNYNTQTFEDIPSVALEKVKEEIITPSLSKINKLGNNYIGVLITDKNIKGSKVLAIQYPDASIKSLAADSLVVGNGIVELYNNRLEEKPKDEIENSLFDIFIATSFGQGVNITFTGTKLGEQVKLAVKFSKDGANNYIDIGLIEKEDNKGSGAPSEFFHIKDGQLHSGKAVWTNKKIDYAASMKSLVPVKNDEELRKTLNTIIEQGVKHAIKEDTVHQWNSLLKTLKTDKGVLQISSFKAIPDFSSVNPQAILPVVTGLQLELKAKEYKNEEQVKSTAVSSEKKSNILMRTNSYLTKVRARKELKEETEGEIKKFIEDNEKEFGEEIKFRELKQKFQNKYSNEPSIVPSGITPADMGFVPKKSKLQEDSEKDVDEKKTPKKKSDDSVFKLSDKLGEDRKLAEAFDNLRKILPLKTKENPNGTITLEEFYTVIENIAGKNFTMGKFKNAVIYLAKNRTKGVEYHEAFHAIFRTFLNQSEINQVYKAAELRYGKPGISVLHDFKKEHPSRTSLSEPDLTKLWYEEKMADEFMGKMNDGFFSKLFNKLKKLLNSFVDLFTKNEDYIDVLFDKIQSGFYKSANPTTDIISFPGEAFKLLKDGNDEYLDYHLSETIVNRITTKLLNMNLVVLTQSSYLKAINEVKEFYSTDNELMGELYNSIGSEGRKSNFRKTLKRINTTLNNEVNFSVIREQVVNQISVLKSEDNDINDEDLPVDYGAKESLEKGGYENLSGAAKKYLSIIQMPYLDELGIELTEQQKSSGVFNTYVDPYKLHNILDRSMPNTNKNFLKRLEFLSRESEILRAFYNKFTKDISIEIGKSITYQTPIQELSDSNTFNIIYSAYHKAKIQLLHTDVDTEGNHYGVYRANINDVQDVQLNSWKANWYNLDLSKSNALAVIEQIDKTFSGNIIKYFESPAGKEEVLTELQDLFSQLGIDLSKGYLEYSFENDKISRKTWAEIDAEDIRKSKTASINSYELYDKQGRETALVEAVERVNTFQEVPPITSDDILYVKISINEEGLYSKGVEDETDVATGDKDVYGRLKRFAEGNAIFDEAVEPVMQRDSAGNPVYSNILPNFTTTNMLLWQNEYRATVLHTPNEEAAKIKLKEIMEKDGDVMEPWMFEKVFQAIKYNHILQGKNTDDIDPVKFSKFAMQNMKILVISGQRRQEEAKENFTQGEGTKYAELDRRASIANMLIFFAESSTSSKKKNTQRRKIYIEANAIKGKAKGFTIVPVIAEHRELKNTQMAYSMPIYQIIDAGGAINQFGIDILKNYLKQEIESIKIINSEIQDPESVKIKDVHNGELRGTKLFNFKVLHQISDTKEIAERIENQQEVSEQELETAVKRMAEDLFQDFYNILKEERLIKEVKTGEEEKIVEQGNLLPDYYLNSGNEVNKNRLAEYFYNSIVNSIGIQNLMYGNLATQYKSPINFFMRIAGASGSKVSNGFGTTSVRVISKEKRNSQLSPNEKIDHTDAQSNATIEWLINKQIKSLGKTPNEIIDILDKLLLVRVNSDGSVLTNREVEILYKYAALAGVKKTQIFTYNFNAKTATETILRHVVSLHNTSIKGKEYPIKQVKFTLDALYLFKKFGHKTLPEELPDNIMEELKKDYAEDYIDTTDFIITDANSIIDSIHSLWKPFPGNEPKHEQLNSMEKDGIDLEFYDSAIKTSVVLDKKMMVSDDWIGEQLVNDEIKDEISSPVQFDQLIGSEQSDTSVNFNGKNTTYKDLVVNVHQKFQGKRQSQSMIKAMKYISKSGQKYPRLLVSKFTKALDSMGGGYYAKEFFKANSSNTDFEYNLNRLTILRRAESLFLSAIGSQTFRNTIQGFKFTIISPEGYDVMRDKSGKIVSRRSLREMSNEEVSILKKGPLEYRQDKNGNWYAEVIISNMIAKGLNLNPGDVVNPKILNLISTRIPGQDKSSFAYLKIVDVLPPETGNVIIYPIDIYRLSGADNDVDSQFAKTFPYYIKGKEIRLFGDYWNQKSEEALSIEDDINTLTSKIELLKTKSDRASKKELKNSNKELIELNAKLSEIDPNEIIFKRAFEEYTEELLNNNLTVKDLLKWELDNNERYQEIQFELGELKAEKAVIKSELESLFNEETDPNIPTKEEVELAKGEQLKQWARYLDIPGRSKMRVEELRSVISLHLYRIAVVDNLNSISEKNKIIFKGLVTELNEIKKSIRIKVFGGLKVDPVTLEHKGLGYAYDYNDFIDHYKTQLEKNIKAYQSGEWEKVEPLSVSESEAILREVEQFLIMNPGNFEIANTPNSRKIFKEIREEMYEIRNLKNPVNFKTTFSPTDIVNVKKIATTASENIGISAVHQTSYQHLHNGGGKNYAAKTNDGIRINEIGAQVININVDAKNNQDAEHFNLDSTTLPIAIDLVQQANLSHRIIFIMFRHPAVADLIRRLTIKKSEYSTESERSGNIYSIIEGYFNEENYDENYNPDFKSILDLYNKIDNNLTLTKEEAILLDKSQAFFIKTILDQQKFTTFRSAFSSLTTLLKGPKSTWGEMNKIEQDLNSLGVEIYQLPKTTGENSEDYGLRHTKFYRQFPEKFVENSLTIINNSPMITELLKSYAVLTRKHASRYFIGQTDFVRQFLKKYSHIWKSNWFNGKRGQDFMNKKLTLYFQNKILRTVLNKEFSPELFITESKETPSTLVQLLEEVKSSNVGHRENPFLKFLTIDKPFQFTLGKLSGWWFHGISVNNRIKKDPISQSKLMTGFQELLMGNTLSTVEENEQARELGIQLINYMIGKDGGAFRGMNFSPYVFPSFTRSIDKSLNIALESLSLNTDKEFNENFGGTKDEIFEEALNYLATDLSNKFYINGTSSGFIGKRGKDKILKYLKEEAQKDGETLDMKEALEIYKDLDKEDKEKLSPIKFDKNLISFNIFANTKKEDSSSEKSVVLRANRKFIETTNLASAVPIEGQKFYGLKPKEYISVKFPTTMEERAAGMNDSISILFQLSSFTVDKKYKALDPDDVIVTKAEYIPIEYKGHSQLETSAFALDVWEDINPIQEFTEENETIPNNISSNNAPPVKTTTPDIEIYKKALSIPGVSVLVHISEFNDFKKEIISESGISDVQYLVSQLDKDGEFYTIKVMDSTGTEHKLFSKGFKASKQNSIVSNIAFQVSNSLTSGREKFFTSSLNYADRSLINIEGISDEDKTLNDEEKSILIDKFCR